jgi:hypothetical protein
MTDDDLLLPGAVARVKAACLADRDVITVNASVKNLAMDATFCESLLDIDRDRRYEASESEAFFLATTKYLSFIGALIVRRELWLSRNRPAYWGTAFAHVGVVFEAPLPRGALVVAAPCVAIRYGTSMWSPGALKIWFSNWPGLIQGFKWISQPARDVVAEMKIGRFARKLLMYRALGMLDASRAVDTPLRDQDAVRRTISRLVASIPRPVASAAAALYCLAGSRGAMMTAYDLAHVPNPGWTSRWVAKRLGVL